MGEQGGVGGFVGIDLGVSCTVASSPAEDRYNVSVDTNDVSGRSTPSAVSFDGKRRLVGIGADGRAMSAPKQTLTHLPLVLGDAETRRRRAEKYLWRFGFGYDEGSGGQLGPVSFDGEELSIEPSGALGVLLRTLASYAGASSAQQPQELCVAVHDFLTEAEVAVVRDALEIVGLGSASLLRHSDAVAAAFAHGAGGALLLPAEAEAAAAPGAEERIVGFVDIGVSHGTVTVVRFAQRLAPCPAGPAAEGAAETEEGDVKDTGVKETVSEFLYRRSEEGLGVQSLAGALLADVRGRIEQKHKCTVDMRSKAGQRLANEVVHTLKQLSMLPDAEFGLEAFTPEGPDGPEFDVALPITRDAFEAAAAEPLRRLRDLLAEAVAAVPAGGVALEGIEVVGGGSRVPAVQAIIKEVAGEAVPLRFGLDGSSCVATGAAAWAAGRRIAVPALATPGAPIAGALGAEALAAARRLEERIEAVNVAEVSRQDKRNALESYVYQVRGWLDGKDGELLKPAMMGPFLDAVTLWFEDAEAAEEPTTFEVYKAKLEETEAFVKSEGAAYFEKKARDHEEQDKAIEKAAEEERQRRKDLGMDADKDDRHMKKEDRLRLAAKNKDEGNDMFKAQKFDDAIRRYKKAIDHVSRPEVLSNMTPEETEEARKIKVSSHLNCSQCYLKAADSAAGGPNGGPNAAEPFYKKAKTSCDDALELDPENTKALFRRSLCWEKLGELQDAGKDIRKALGIAPEDADLKRSQERLEKLLKRQKDGQKKVFSKMFG